MEDIRLIGAPDDYHVIEQLQKNVARDKTLEKVIERHTDGDDGGLTRAASSGLSDSRRPDPVAT